MKDFKSETAFSLFWAGGDNYLIIEYNDELWDDFYLSPVWDCLTEFDTKAEAEAEDYIESLYDDN